MNWASVSKTFSAAMTEYNTIYNFPSFVQFFEPVFRDNILVIPLYCPRSTVMCFQDLYRFIIC